MNYIIQAVKSVPILLAVFALHVVLLWQLVPSAPAKTPPKPPPKPPKPIMVSLITPPPPAPVPIIVKKPPKTVSKPVKRIQKSLKPAKPKRTQTKRVKRKPVKATSANRPKKSKKAVRSKKVTSKKAVRSKKVTSKKAVRLKKVTSNRTAFAEPKKATTFRAQPVAIAKNVGITSSPTPSAKPSQRQHRSELPSRRSHQAKPATRVTTPPLFRAAYLHNPHPAYPRISKRRGEQGTVLLRVKVNQNGRAALVKIKQSSGFNRLDKAARQAVNEWRFVPAKKAGQPVTGWVIVPIVFKLR